MKQSQMPWGLLDAEHLGLVFANSALTRRIKQHQLEKGLNPVRDWPEMQALIQQCVGSQRFVALDSDELGARVELLPNLDANGRVQQIQLFWLERAGAQAESAVQKEAVFSQLVDEFPHNVFLCNEGGEIFWTNKTSNRFKFGVDDIVDFSSTAWVDKIHPDDLNMAFRNFSTGMAIGHVEPFRARLKKYTGEFEWYLFTGKPILDAAGKVRHWVGVNINIDKFKREEESTQASAQTMRQQLEVYVQRLEEAQQLISQTHKLDLMGNLAGSVAHELNNLLFVMGLNTEVLQRRIDDEGLKDNLKAVRESIRKAARLSSQLAGFAGRSPQNSSVVMPAQLLKDIEELLRKAAGAEVQLAIEVAADIGNVQVDRAYLENALINLIINARDAVDGRGAVQIRVSNESRLHNEAQGDFVAFHVSDNGSGFSDDVKAQLFTPFFTTKTAGNGAGLGLPMVKSFVESSHGFVEVQSQPGQGSRFSLYFPQSIEPAESVVDAAALKDLQGDETVLVVEDDPSVREAVAAALCDQGYKIVTAIDPEHAILFIQRGIQMDLIVSDVKMPGKLTVLDLIAHVEQHLPGMPILFATGYSADIVVKQGMIEGKYPVLFKPFSSDELSLKVRSLLQEKKARANLHESQDAAALVNLKS